MTSRRPAKKSHRKSPKKSHRKSPKKSRSASPVFFEVWYHDKPRMNAKVKTMRKKVQRDDDNEWLLTGQTNASIPEVKAWVKSLGKTKKVQVGR